MPEFAYKAKDSRGKVRTGKVKAKTKAMAKNQLVRQKMRVVNIRAVSAEGDGANFWSNFYYYDEEGKLQLQFGEPQPKIKDIVIFTKQFATMLKSGVPLIQALAILASQQRVRAFGKALDTIRHNVEQGSTFSDAVEQFPKYFDRLYVAMVRAGEMAGGLDEIMLKLVTYIEKSAKIKAQVKSAMMYPAIVLLVSIVVVSGLLLFVVPTFAEQYEGSGQELPGLTQMVIDFSDGLANNWLFVFGGIAVGITLFKIAVKTDRGRKEWDRILLMSPGVGILLKKIAVGRFCQTMATMLSSGVNLLEALQICAASAGNVIIEEFTISIRAAVEQGDRLSEPLGEGDLFPPMVVSMVSVGEATGQLDEMLRRVSEFYEDEVDLALATVLSMIEPIMIVVIGGIVAFVVIAMYLPIFSMASMSG